VLSRENSLGLAGDDGKFSGEELRDAVFDNTAHTATLLRNTVVAACTANPLVEVAEVLDGDDVVVLPAEAVDVSAACAVLAAWDGRYDLDRAGAVVWRGLMNRFDNTERTETGPLFVDQFDPTRPTATPSVPTDDPTRLLEALARSVQTLAKAGFPVDTSLGAAQFTERSTTRIPIHGGTGVEGVTNVVQWSDNDSSSEPTPTRGDPVAPDSQLRDVGFPVNYGSSFILAVDYTAGAPRAWSMLTYGQTEDRTSPLFEQQTVRFSEKSWREVAFTDDAIEADPNLVVRVLTVP
jgi:acyl-homoserine-lactone acylase